MTHTTEAPVSKSAAVSNSTVHFASKLHPRLGNSSQNLFYSPFSLLSVLSMCRAGAKGSTQDCLSELLGLPAASAGAKPLLQMPAAAATGGDAQTAYELLMANALWIADGLSLNAEYKQTVQTEYGGEVVQVNYQQAAGEAVDKINRWCDEKTRGKIPTIVTRQNIDADTRLLLTNAIYFKGKWQTPFQEGRVTDDDFQGAGQVPTMHHTSEFRYAENADFQALEMEYEGGDLAMLILLPRDEISKIDTDLGSAYQLAVTNLSREQVIVAIPRFKIESTYCLRAALTELGAGLAFSNDADFSGITDVPLKISEVIHKTFVQVDTEGTEAAAATGAVARTLAAVYNPDPPKVFKADRPFVFLIRNLKSGNVLFAGRLVKP